MMRDKPSVSANNAAGGWWRVRLGMRSLLVAVLVVTLVNFGLLNVWYMVRSWQPSGPAAAASGRKPEFTVVWFFTENYAHKSARLERSCRELGISYSFTKFVYNTSKPRSAHSLLSLKPYFILTKMSQLDTPIVFADSDLVFLQYPHMFTSNMSTEIDYMGVNWYVEWGLERGRTELLTSSGVSYWNTTPASRQLLRSWHHALQCFDNVYAPDDQVLDAQFNAHFWMQRVRTKWLTLRGYLAINEWGLKTNETVIDHPDANNVHEGHFHRPSVVPQWVLESGRYFQHHILIGATCGADIDVANRPTMNPRVLDLHGLNDDEEGAGAGVAVGWRPNCTDFIVAVHLSLPKPVRAVRMRLNPLPPPPPGSEAHAHAQPMAVKVRGYDRGKYEYVGCYHEHQQVRELNQFRGMDIEKNSPERCTEACAGFAYFGLQFTWECWCGTSFGAYGAVANCSHSAAPCPGNPSHGCGGSLINSVYRKVVKEITAEFDLQTEWVEIDLSQVIHHSAISTSFSPADRRSMPLSPPATVAQQAHAHIVAVFATVGPCC
eukprot:TRINITY_DN7732_c1_g1_i2.p1 TRINITY_DN7732_c1_g1~~TRINITY_DN7732_c1_g1_i2.p1  ORF type:complete len:547 (-),score=163.77 TRINITY_DN7732_c1_g1_i2:69-1709(-)